MILGEVPHPLGSILPSSIRRWLPHYQAIHDYEIELREEYCLPELPLVQGASLTQILEVLTVREYLHLISGSLEVKAPLFKG